MRSVLVLALLLLGCGEPEPRMSLPDGVYEVGADAAYGTIYVESEMKFYDCVRVHGTKRVLCDGMLLDLEIEE